MPQRKRDVRDIVFDPSQSGLDRMLGPLESMIMEILWSEPYHFTVEDVVQQLAKNGVKRRYTTVASTLMSLCKKLLVVREKGESAVFVYRSMNTRYVFEQRVIFRVLDKIKSENENILREWLVLHARDFV
jgi:predicted transcriptional regulator